MAVPPTSVYPGSSRPRVPLTSSAEATHRQQIASRVNAILSGQIDATLQVNLAPSVAVTVISDGRISVQTCAVAAPLTAHAAAEVAAGGLWWVPTAGTLTIHHANNAQTDRSFMFALIG